VSKPYEVLFLCTGNSARSVMAECLLNRLGAGRFRAHSAGSHPKGAVHPTTLALLGSLGYDTSALASKSWDVFARAGAPALDIVVTVCDAAAGESCPLWPGHPLTVHWGVPDPAAFAGPKPDELACFQRIYGMLERRVRNLVALPIERLDARELRRELEAIGRERLGEAGAE
jgi:arsenate reductase